MTGVVSRKWKAPFFLLGAFAWRKCIRENMIEKVRPQAYYIHSSSLGGDAMKSLDKIAGVKINAEEPIGQLIIELDKAELRSRYVALAEFRDKILPKSGFNWAKDPVKVKSLLKDSVESRPGSDTQDVQS